MRHVHLIRFRTTALMACAALLISACGEPPSVDDDPDTGPAADSAAGDGGGATADTTGTATDAGTSSSGADSGSSGSATDTAAAADTGGSSSGADAGPSTSDDAGAAVDAGGSADAGAVDAGPPPKKLPLPDCAKGSCAGCSLCPETPMCLDGTSYKNDCEAICKEQAFDWPKGYAPQQGACPACKGCVGHKIQCNAQKGECEECNSKDGCVGTGDSCKKNEDCKWTPWCATLKSGAKVTIEKQCEASCMDLDPKVGKNPTWGPCKSKCSQPKPAGGGCQMNLWQPVCSKKDGKTYANKCAMQNCAKQGCYAVGGSKKTSQCEEGKMEMECVGECYDADNAAWKGCTKDCKPVCGIAKNGKGVNYRNKCIASAEGAKVGDCAGITSTANDKCSAQMYVESNAPCCDDVQYELQPNPICATLGSGTGEQWITFRNMAEFTCWDKKAKATKGAKQWNFKFQGACVCKCLKNKKEVCGADGFTYLNACHAKCYNGDKFTWKEGACPTS